MRMVVTGASGNLGTAVLRAAVADPAVTAVVGVCRRPPAGGAGKVSWAAADVAADDLDAAFRGADVVVHLAWLIQPARDPAALHRTNVVGSSRVFAAAVRAGAWTLVHLSSVGVYSPGPKERPVGEDWPREGVASSTYSRQKAAVEAALDEVAARHTGLRVVRLRPGLIFQRSASSEIARYFVGPLLPRRALRPQLSPLLPFPAGLRFQAVHADDVAAAVLAAARTGVAGAFNVAAEPVLDAASVGRLLRARALGVPVRLVRAAADLTFRARLQPTDAGWVDLAASCPVMATARARDELGWTPRHTATDALAELLAGFAAGAAGPTPVLAARP